MSADIPVNDSGKQGKIKTVSVLTNTFSLICHLQQNELAERIFDGDCQDSCMNK